MQNVLFNDDLKCMYLYYYTIYIWLELRKCIIYISWTYQIHRLCIKTELDFEIENNSPVWNKYWSVICNIVLLQAISCMFCNIFLWEVCDCISFCNDPCYLLWITIIAGNSIFHSAYIYNICEFLVYE